MDSFRAGHVWVELGYEFRKMAYVMWEELCVSHFLSLISL